MLIKEKKVRILEGGNLSFGKFETWKGFKEVELWK